MDEPKIRLLCGDDVVVETSQAVARKCMVLRNMLDDVISDGACRDIPLPNVRSDVLKRVLAFCEYHLHDDDDEPRTESLLKDTKGYDDDDPSVWDEVFCDFRQQAGTDGDEAEIQRRADQIHYDLLNAANCLDVPRLVQLLCKRLAGEIPDTVEGIRKRFGIVSDLTPDDEEEVRNSTSWIRRKNHGQLFC